MAYCKEDGKDQVIFASKDDLLSPSKAIVNLDEDEDGEPGLILANGEINWDCPCLGGMATGPCGNQFRSAFSCFHYSDAEPKGSDCYEAFLTMQQCMGQFPELYPPAKANAEEALDQLGSSEPTKDDLEQIPAEVPLSRTAGEVKS